MKKFTYSLRALNSFKLMLLVLTIGIISCQKSDPGPNPQPQTDYCPNMPGIQSSPTDCPPIPAPTGTATAVATTIVYDTVATFTFKFTNTDAVYFNGVYAGVDSGIWRSGKLRGDSGFQVSAHGKNGTTLVLPNKINITVGQDPRITELATGVHKLVSLMARPVDSPNVAYRVVPFGCSTDTYTFTWNGFTGMPGNPATSVSCAFGTINAAWFFVQNSEDQFYWHGITHDQFALTYNTDGTGKGFKIRDNTYLYQWNPGGPFLLCYRIQEYKH